MQQKNLQLGRFLRTAAVALAALLAGAVQAAVPGITGTSTAGTSTVATFNLTASAEHISQPDGASIYSWGYGCASPSTPAFAPGGIPGGSCSAMQIPGPTLIVTQGATVTIVLANNLPAAAGNTSILFPGFKVTATGGTPGVLAREAAVGQSVTYSFVADTPGTHAYYSGTQGDLQVEMGLYGALIVLPNLGGPVPTGYGAFHASLGSNQPDTCIALGSKLTRAATDTDFRLAAAAYDNPQACYDREYLFQMSEIDPRIHIQAEAQKDIPCVQAGGCMIVETEPYHPAYFLLNGRSMPDDLDPNYAQQYPNQPYNSNPHMHPGEALLLRIIGQGRMQHPFHEHANHVRVLGRDGNLLLTSTNKLAGPLLFTTTTTPGLAIDAIFGYTGKNLNWDIYAHGDGITTDACVPDANGYYTTASGAPSTAKNYYEWCADHKKALENKPFGQVGSGGPVTLPDPNILTNGAWYAGSPYFGPDANARAVGPTAIPPFGTIANDPGTEAGFAYMWHSHNEREITTNNIFPGGMMTMLLVDPWVYSINEAN
jgi:FtsP/CotA-like multicopper oxidase with cupredoxin domain